MIEPFGIDESWLDVTASRKLFGTGEEIAEMIRKDVKETIGITVSIGVSFNKVFAKLGSDYKKPDAITVISESNFKNIVYPLPVGDLLFIGKKTEQVLLGMGIKTIGDLAESNIGMLRMRLGKMGEMIWHYARGEDNSPVAVSREDAKSIGNGFTFRHDLVTKEECRVGIDFLTEEIGRRLRKSGMKCSTVQLTLKDEYLRSIQRQRQVGAPTDVARDIAAVAYSILLDEWTEGNPIRMITVTASGLIRADMACEQINMFAPQANVGEDKSKKREETIDKIRQKYGKNSIVTGSIMDSDIGVYDSDIKKDG
jgi:DNA polymerase-4